jgi:CRP-like cAMP-binding protein
MRSPHTRSVTGNALLDSLPAATRRFCTMAAQRQTWRREQQLIGQGAQATHVFFPAGAVCTLTMELASGSKAEAATTGREGVIGLASLYGQARSPYSAYVLIPGDGYAIELPLLTSLLHRSRCFGEVLLTYATLRLNVQSRMTACNAYHSIEQRIARWLLTMQDRAGCDGFALTHVTLSEMVAATRPKVSVAAARLRESGVIDYRPGYLTILNRAGLQEVSCDCYEATAGYAQTPPAPTRHSAVPTPDPLAPSWYDPGASLRRS